MRSHWTEILEATLLELRTWLRYGCFRRRLKRECTNTMDCRFVTKWKKVKVRGTLRRIIRQRLTLRGFKDREKDTLQRFAGTAQRQSQLMLSSITAANVHFVDWCTDISKAFLQGLSFKELHELTGAPMRNRSFTLPQWASKVLCQLEGFEN